MVEFEEVKGIQFWNAEKEKDELLGEVTEIKTTGQYGVQHVIKIKNGDLFLTPSHAVLQNRMQSIKVGDVIKIVYEGEDLSQKKKGQNAPKIYRVFKKP